MAHILQYAYHCMDILNQYVLNNWPLKIVLGFKQLSQPTRQTELTVRKIFNHILSTDDADELQKLCCPLVSSLPLNENVLGIRDKNTEFSLLQIAVAKGAKSIVIALLKWPYEKLENDCSSPLHLAALLGYAEILEILLKNGFDPGSAAGICYPQWHLPSGRRNWFGNPVYICSLNKRFPTHWAVYHDNAKCLSLLLASLKRKGISVDLVNLLHYACDNGSNNCITLILSHDPSIVNCKDSDGVIPLFKAVRWGIPCTEPLVNAGACVNFVASDGSTALHQLFDNHVCGVFSLYDTTELLLKTGIEQLINSRNKDGETPLHLLVSHVSNIRSVKLPHHVIQASSEIHQDYQNQVIQTLELLFQFNADVGIVDNYGFDPLHRLMHIALRLNNRESTVGEERSQHLLRPPFQYHKTNYVYLKQALQIFLSYGPNINRIGPDGTSLLYIFFQYLLNEDISYLCVQSDAIIEILGLLLTNGSKLQDKEPGYYQLVSAFASCLTNCPDDGPTMAGFSSLVCRVLAVSVENNQNLNNVDVVRWEDSMGFPRSQSRCALDHFMVLFEFYTWKNQQLIEIYKWLRVLLQLGADPDLQPNSKFVVCHSQSSIYLKKQGSQCLSACLTYRNSFMDYAVDFFMLFYNTMSHEPLFNYLNAAKITLNPARNSGCEISRVVIDLAENPRSLKQSARVVIYKSIDRKIAERVPLLPLPNPLKAYLQDID